MVGAEETATPLEVPQAPLIGVKVSVAVQEAVVPLLIPAHVQVVVALEVVGKIGLAGAAVPLAQKV